MTNNTAEVRMALRPMIDTHCHLDDSQFSDDIDQVLDNSRLANVNRWILIGYDPDRWNDAIQFSGTYQGMDHTLGVHPAHAEKWNHTTANRLRSLLTSSHACGIGETGFDFYRDNAPWEAQAEAFAGQLDIAIELRLPIVIHMRDAEQEILNLLSNGRQLPTLIFHSFDGGETLMDFVIDTGSYVGIGGLATRQKSENLRTQLQRVPKERIVLETDSPYLVPARQKERRNEPAQIATIAMMMSEYLGMTPAELADQSTVNAKLVFGLKHD